MLKIMLVFENSATLSLGMFLIRSRKGIFLRQCESVEYLYNNYQNSLTFGGLHRR